MASSSTATAHPANGNFAYDEQDSDIYDDPAMLDYEDDYDDELIPGVNNRAFVIKSSWKVRMTTVSLWFMLFLAASGGVFAYFRATPAPAAKIPPTIDTSAPDGFAQAFITTYLQSYKDNADQIKQFYPDNSVPAVLEAPQFRVWHTFVARTDTIQTNYWSVLVGADVSKYSGTDANTGQFNFVKVPELRYYRVGIYKSIDNDGFATFIATSLPSDANPVPVSNNLPTTVASQGAPATAGQTNTLDSFFKAYLVGDGELKFFRTVNPNSHLREFANPPAKGGSIEIVSALSRYTNTPAGKLQNEADVTVIVKATDADGVIQTSSYTVVMEYTNNKTWLVDDVELAVPLAPQTGSNTTN